MIKPEYKKLLSEMGVTPFGIALQAFLDEEYDIINNVQSCTSWEDTIGRKHALATLERLFSFMRPPKPVEKKLNQYE